MSRGVDWDKVHRQKKASNPEFYPMPPATYKKQQKAFSLQRRLRRTSSFRPTPPTPTKPLTLTYWFRTLEISTPEGVFRALFQKEERSDSKVTWRCLRAEGILEWMLRMRNIENISHWIQAKKYQPKWGPKTKSPETDGRQRTSKPSDTAPAEEYMPNQASHPQGSNTGVSLMFKPIGADIPRSSIPTNEPQIGRSGMA